MIITLFLFCRAAYNRLEVRWIWLHRVPDRVLSFNTPYGPGTSFHPRDNAGLLLFASQYSNGSGSYILLQMREQRLEFGLSTGNHKILLQYVYKYFMFVVMQGVRQDFYFGRKYEHIVLHSSIIISISDQTLISIYTNITHQSFSYGM